MQSLAYFFQMDANHAKINSIWTENRVIILGPKTDYLNTKQITRSWSCFKKFQKKGKLHLDFPKHQIDCNWLRFLLPCYYISIATIKMYILVYIIYKLPKVRTNNLYR